MGGEPLALGRGEALSDLFVHGRSRVAPDPAARIARRAHLRQGRLRRARGGRARRARGDGPSRPSGSPQAQDIPLNFLENILAPAQRAGSYAASAAPRAATGWPARPTEITLADVIRAVEGPLASVRGERPEDVDYPGAAEPLQEVWIALRASLRAVLENVTLADVAAGKLPERRRRR